MNHFKVLSAILLVYQAAVPHGATNNLTASELECKLTGIESRLSIASQLIETARRKLPSELKERSSENTKIPKPIDCSDVYTNGYRKDGIYQIWPQSRLSKGPLNVYCDMSDSGGRWLLIQRRGDFDSPKDYFHQDWNAYKTGFGDLQKDFWIGNDNLFALTNQRAYQIKFDLRDWEQNFTYATYDEFWIDDELQSYTLHVTGYRGTAGDSFTYHNGVKFSTKDKENDSHADYHCAVKYKGAWWYQSCHRSNLNGYYLKGKHETDADGVEWIEFRGYYYSLKDTVMKIRPTNFGDELNLERSPE